MNDIMLSCSKVCHKPDISLSEYVSFLLLYFDPQDVLFRQRNHSLLVLQHVILKFCFDDCLGELAADGKHKAGVSVDGTGGSLNGCMVVCG